MFKPFFTPFVLLALLGSTAFSAQAQKLTVSSTPLPASEVLEFVKPILAKQDIDLDIKVFTDYLQPNLQLIDGNVDANLYQHQPFLDSFNDNHDSDIVAVGTPIYVIPMAAYSNKIKDVDEIKNKALIALPNDPTNEARALLLLQKAGLIKLKDPDDVLATTKDIVENPKKLKFKELEAASVPRVLPDVDLALINTNYALEAGLNPLEDSLFIEDKDSPYANEVATLSENKNNPAIKKLVEVLQSDAAREYMLDHYKGSVVPVF